MTPTIAQSILIAVAVLAVLFLIHRFAPTSTAAKVEDVVIADAKKAEPVFKSMIGTLETDASQLLAQVELWLTDESAANAKLAQAASLTAEANADKVRRQAALRQHIATLQAKLPAA